MTPERQQQLRHFQFVDCAVRSAGHFYLMASHIYQLDDDCDDPDGEPAVAADPEPGLREAIPDGFLRKPQAQWLPALRWRRMEGEDTGWQDWIDVSHAAPGRLPDALRMFEAASRALQQANADLLAGSPPNRDDAFALRHWRARGYLH